MLHTCCVLCLMGSNAAPAHSPARYDLETDLDPASNARPLPGYLPAAVGKQLLQVVVVFTPAMGWHVMCLSPCRRMGNTNGEMHVLLLGFC